MGTTPTANPSNGVSEPNNWFVGTWSHLFCGMFILGKRAGFSYPGHSNIQYHDFTADKQQHGASGCPALDRWCVHSQLAFMLTHNAIRRNYVGVLMNSTHYEVRVNGFLVASDLKTYTSPESSGTRDIHIGYYNSDTTTDANPIHLAHLTYHNEASFGPAGPNRPGVLLLSDGIGAYVDADHEGRCQFPAAFVGNDPMSDQGVCLAFSAKPEPVCAESGGAIVCTKAVFAPYEGFANRHSFTFYAVVAQKVVRCEPPEAITGRQNCTSTKTVG